MKRLIFPLLWELIFIVTSILLPNRTLYLYFLFYLGLIIYFRKDYSFCKQCEVFKDFRKFWLPVLLTSAAIGLCYVIKTRVLMRFFMVPDGRISIWMSDSFPVVLLFALTTILMEPLAEELFFRQALIVLPEKDDGKSRLVHIALIAGTVMFSLLICSLSHATGLLGIAEAALMALPLTIVYLKTRNIYIPLLVHFGFNLYDKVPSVVYSLMRLSLR